MIARYLEIWAGSKVDPTVKSKNRKGDPSNAMWKPKHSDSLSISSSPESCLPAPALPALNAASRKPAAAVQQSAIGKGLVLAGGISGSDSLESLLIEGTVEGSINLPASHVTVGRDGQVTASIIARDIVVMGTVNGDITASVRVDIHAEGSVTGILSAPRICVEDGAFLLGKLEVQKPVIEPVVVVDLPPDALDTLKSIRIPPQVRTMQIRPSLRTA